MNLPHTCCLKYHEKVLPRKLVVGCREALGCYLPQSSSSPKRTERAVPIPTTKKYGSKITSRNPARLGSQPGPWPRLNLVDPRKAKPSSSTPRDGQASAEAQVQERKVWAYGNAGSLVVWMTESHSEKRASDPKIKVFQIFFQCLEKMPELRELRRHTIVNTRWNISYILLRALLSVPLLIAILNNYIQLPTC